MVLSHITIPARLGPPTSRWTQHLIPARKAAARGPKWATNGPNLPTITPKDAQPPLTANVHQVQSTCCAVRRQRLGATGPGSGRCVARVGSLGAVLRGLDAVRGPHEHYGCSQCGFLDGFPPLRYPKSLHLGLKLVLCVRILTRHCRRSHQKMNCWRCSFDSRTTGWCSRLSPPPPPGFFLRLRGGG